jgi:hypothetical protein
VAPTGWVEQALKTADLSVLLPKASWWAELNSLSAAPPTIAFGPLPYAASQA